MLYNMKSCYEKNQNIRSGGTTSIMSYEAWLQYYLFWSTKMPN